MAITNTILGMGEGGYGNLLGNVSSLAGSAGSIIKKVKALTSNEKSVGAIRDYNTNGFLAQNSLFRPDFFARMFDEPTYVSFRIEFMFNDPENKARNTAYNNHGILDSAMTTAFYDEMYDHMPEPFLDSFLKSVDGAVDASFGVRYSTENYLDVNLGDHARAALLHNFKLALKDIQENFPYYFTSLSGLDTLATIDPERGMRVKDGTIELECMEGLDMKITQLIQMYRKIVWDDVYQRWVLPDMMRYFGMRIYVSEIRIFSDTKRENDNSLPTYDFSDADIRNATYKGQYDGKNWFEKGLDILGKATAVSNAFLGTKSVITKALNYTSGTVNTVMGAYNSIAGALNGIQYCNNAINEVMPTLCFECHMCEFDIENTLSYIHTLHSDSHRTEAMSPKLKIKVGQVKEKQAYPLNKFLQKSDLGYAKTFADRNYVDTTGITKYTEIQRLRNESIGFSADFINDDLFNKRYQGDRFASRITEYMNNSGHLVGDTKAQTVSEKRMSDKMIDNFYDLSYNPDNQSQAAAKEGLFATVMNEAVAIGTSVGGGSDVFGTQSKATNPESSDAKAIREIGEAMNAALERIYGGPELTSMAVQGVSDQKRASIAKHLFDDYITNLEQTTPQETPLGQFLKNYRLFENDSNNVISESMSGNKIDKMSNNYNSLY